MSFRYFFACIHVFFLSIFIPNLAYSAVPNGLDDAKLILHLNSGATVDISGIAANPAFNGTVSGDSIMWEKRLREYLPTRSTYYGIEGALFNNELTIRTVITHAGQIYVGTIGPNAEDHLLIFSTIRSRCNYLTFDGQISLTSGTTPKNNSLELNAKQNILSWIAGDLYQKLYQAGLLTGPTNNHETLYERPHKLTNRFKEKITVICSRIYHQQADYSYYPAAKAVIDNAMNAQWSPIANSRDQDRDLSRSFELQYSKQTGSYVELYAGTDNNMWSATTAYDSSSPALSSGSYGGDNYRKWRISFNSSAHDYSVTNTNSASARLGLAGQYPERIEMKGRTTWSSFSPSVLIAAFGSITTTNCTESPAPGDDGNPPPFSYVVYPDGILPVAVIQLLLNDKQDTEEANPAKEAYIINERNSVMGHPGKTTTASITIPQADTNYTFSYQLTAGFSNPSWLTVNGNGILTFVVPADAEAGSSFTFSVTITNDQMKASTTLRGSLYIPEQEILVEDTISSSGDSVVADAWTGVAVEVPASSKTGTTSVQILKGNSEEGTPYLAVSASNPDAISGQVTLHLPDPETLDGTESAFVSASSRGASSPVNNLWAHGYAYFSGDGYRLPSNELQGEWDFLKGMQFFKKEAWQLLGYVETENDIVSQREPVLFIHGFNPMGLGGGYDTWANFHSHIYDLDIDGRRFLPFEFKWRTNARFQDVAEDLITAINLIVDTTGRDVHIVAHSFGGLLTRTMLQRINSGVFINTSFIASITTLGTPHSGIVDNADRLDGFPKGQDSPWHELCSQTSCYQAGEPVLFLPIAYEILELDSSFGFIVKKLSQTSSSAHPLPTGLPFQVCIGMTTNRGALGYNNIIDAGDGLISFEGQRFHPGFGTNAVLLSKNTDHGAEITERILNMGDTLRPGMYTANEGYRHSHSVTTPSWFEPAEPYAESRSHHGYLAVKDWLARYASVSTGLNKFTLKLRILDTQHNPVTGAKAKVKIGTSMIMDSGSVSDSLGFVTIEVPFYPSTTYKPIISASGFKTECFDRGLPLLAKYNGNRSEPGICRASRRYAGQHMPTRREHQQCPHRGHFTWYKPSF